MELSTLSTVAKTTLAFLRANHGPAIHRYARIAGTMVAFAITVAWIAADCAYDLGRQTREAIETRNNQLAAVARFIQEFTEGITLSLQFSEIVFPAETPMLVAASGPIALLAAAPTKKRAPRKAKATDAPARKRQTRKAAAAA